MRGKIKIRIFGKNFVKNNRLKCLIIYKDKVIQIQEYFFINDIDEEDKKGKKFELLLVELKNIYDRSYMFYECTFLLGFALRKDYQNKNNEEKDLDPEEAKKYYDFYLNDKIEKEI